MSTNELFVLPKTLQRFHEGPLSVHIDAYISASGTRLFAGKSLRQDSTYCRFKWLAPEKKPRRQGYRSADTPSIS